MAEEAQLREFKERYVKSLTSGGHSSPTCGLLSRLTFSWISPFIKIGKILSIDAEMLPQLSPSNQHANYSRRIREAFRERAGGAQETLRIARKRLTPCDPEQEKHAGLCQCEQRELRLCEAG